MKVSIVASRFNEIIVNKLLSGSVIRGAPSHYDYVCTEVSKGIAQVGLKTEVPVIFGVITTENIKQAIERTGNKAEKISYDCTLSTIEMVNLIKKL